MSDEKKTSDQQLVKWLRDDSDEHKAFFPSDGSYFKMHTQAANRIDQLEAQLRDSQDQLAATTAKLEQAEAELEALPPHLLMKPNLSLDGNKWCALYGVDLQEGVAGFGETIEDALKEFDIEWNRQVGPAARTTEGVE